MAESEGRRRIALPQGAEPQRLDRVLVDALGLSRARAKKLLEVDAVRVNGRRQRKGAQVQGGDVIEVAEPALESGDRHQPPLPETNLPVQVALEDAAVVILEKPSGMASHPLEPGERGTVANFLAARFPECVAANPADPREAGLLQRLDLETSGLLTAARTPAAHRMLREAFSARAVEKRYLAATFGPLADEGEIELPLAHAPGDARRMLAVGSEDRARELKARPARTSFRVKERRGDCSLLEVRIDTGVMHQIRAHFAAIGAPILGDALYAGPALGGLTRHFLHASLLSFTSPATGQPITARSVLPEDLAAAWAALPS